MSREIGTYRRVLVPPQEIIPILEFVKKLNPDGEYLFSKNGEVLTPATFSFNNKTKKENGRKITLALGDFLPF